MMDQSTSDSSRALPRRLQRQGACAGTALRHLRYRHALGALFGPISPLQDLGPRTGRVSTLLVLALLIGLGVLLWGTRPAQTPPAELTGPPAYPAPPERESETELPEITGEFANQRDASSAQATPQTTARTEGFGTLRGVLLDRTGEGVPADWTLVLSPNKAIRTPTPRRELRFQFEEGEERFEVEDVPLGAYDVWVEAPGANRRTTPVLLVKGSSSPFVSLELHARGYLEGVVLDEANQAVGELTVTLVSIAKRGDRSTQTDGAGRYLFDDLLDGEYQIYFGARNNPLIGPEDLSFQAPSLHYPVRRVPELGSVLVRVVDVNRSPIVGAQVDGFAPRGGIMSGESDSEGLCEVSNLVPGRYRLSIRGNGDSAGRAVCVVASGARTEIEVIVRD